MTTLDKRVKDETLIHWEYQALGPAKGDAS